MLYMVSLYVQHIVWHLLAIGSKPHMPSSIKAIVDTFIYFWNLELKMTRSIVISVLVILILSIYCLALETESNNLSVKELKTRFIELLSKQDADLNEAKSILSQIPLDPKAFHDYDELEDPMNPVIANISVVLLHYLLNKFMLASSAQEKSMYLEFMQMGMERGMDVAATYKEDPPLYLKAVMVKEMNLTVSMIKAAKKYMAQEVIARSRKMSRFLIMVYSLMAEVVPTAKLLLHVEKIAEVASNRTTSPGGKPSNRKDIAKAMLHNARLDKPAVKASELLLFSPTYINLVEQISTPNAFSKSISLFNVIKSLDEFANVAISTLIQAIQEDDRAEIALEHFFDLHVIPDESRRNAFHYLCMARSTVTLKTLIESYKTKWEKQDNYIKMIVAERMISAFEFADHRGHTPLTYCAMRYGHRRHDDIGSRVIEFLDVLSEDITDSSVLNHVQEMKARLFVEEEKEAVAVDFSGEIIFNDNIDSISDIKDKSKSMESESGGWNSDRLQVDLGKYPYFTDANHCDIKVVHLNSSIPNQQEFFAEYLNQGIPVLFRGAALDPSKTRMHALRHVFRKDTFVKIYGSKKVTASTLPYGESFGVQSMSKTLRQVANADRVVNLLEKEIIASSSDQSTSSLQENIPLYTFLVPSPEWGARISQEVPLPEPLLTPNPQSGELTPAYGAQLQFYLGAAGTGAPIHYHGPAINSLAYGEKKWVLFPPDYSFYSTIPALQYFLGGEFSTTHPMSIEQENTDIDMKYLRGMQCTQHAGDVMFVPSLWGHATLNMKQSIGVAHEFSVETFIME